MIVLFTAGASQSNNVLAERTRYINWCKFSIRHRFGSDRLSWHSCRSWCFVIAVLKKCHVAEKVLLADGWGLLWQIGRRWLWLPGTYSFMCLVEKTDIVKNYIIYPFQSKIIIFIFVCLKFVICLELRICQIFVIFFALDSTGQNSLSGLLSHFKSF